METLFRHRFSNRNFLTNPADSTAMLDNVGEMLDHACAMARTLYAGAGLVDADLEPQDLKNAAWALAHQIQDAQAVLAAWEEARTNQGGGHHAG